MNSRIDAQDLRDLHAMTAVEPDAVERLHRRLEDAALADGLIDVAYTTIDTPLGSLLLATTPTGLVRVAYESQGHDKVLAMLAARLSPRILRAPRRLDTAARQLCEYFEGTRHEFDLPLDRSLSRGFRELVQRHLPDIEYGHTRSYAEVARALGNPGAVRAVGTACATNPLPIVVPCHRVLRADGTLGRYAGGPEAKAALLHLETAA